MRTHKTLFLAVMLMVATCSLFVVAQSKPQSKPKLTLDEFFNSVSFPAVELSPDGNSVVIVAERADWDQQIFRSDLWLYRDDSKAGCSNSVDAVRPRLRAQVVSRRQVDRLPLRAQAFLRESGRLRFRLRLQRRRRQPDLPHLAQRRRSLPRDPGRRRCPRLFLVRGFAIDLLRHAPALDQIAEGRLQETMEGRRAVPHRRARRHDLRARHTCGACPPRRHPRESRKERR